MFSFNIDFIGTQGFSSRKGDFLQIGSCEFRGQATIGIVSYKPLRSHEPFCSYNQVVLRTNCMALIHHYDEWCVIL